MTQRTSIDLAEATGKTGESLRAVEAKRRSEIVTHIALNVCTNYLNKAIEVTTDFPPVATLATRRYPERDGPRRSVIVSLWLEKGEAMISVTPTGGDSCY